MQSSSSIHAPLKNYNCTEVTIGRKAFLLKKIPTLFDTSCFERRYKFIFAVVWASES